MTAKAKICGTLLLLLFIVHLVGMSLFIHIHVLDRETITHSHIYSGTKKNPGHVHSSSQFVLIALLSTILMVAAAMRAFVTIDARRVLLFVCLREQSEERLEVCTNSLRGPPAML